MDDLKKRVQDGIGIPAGRGAGMRMVGRDIGLVLLAIILSTCATPRTRCWSDQGRMWCKTIDIWGQVVYDGPSP